VYDFQGMTEGLRFKNKRRYKGNWIPKGCKGERQSQKGRKNKQETRQLTNDRRVHQGLFEKISVVALGLADRSGNTGGKELRGLKVLKPNRQA